MATLKTLQLANAKAMGTKAFNSGLKCICSMDVKFMEIINSRQIGETPKKEAKSTSLMKAWYEGWTRGNLNSK